MATSTVGNSTSSSTSILNSLSSASGTNSTTTADEMQTRFLNLLVTQLKNQDPLNPMDNSQMTTQLSQISTVSGIEKLNATLEKLLGNYSSTNTMQAAAMIGKSVLTPGSKMEVGQYGGVGGAELASAADKVSISVKNAAGNEVALLDLGEQKAGTFNFVWDGKMTDGTAAATGSYTFSVKASQGTKDVEATALQAGMVNAVTLNKTGFDLQLYDGSSVAYGDIKQIIN